MQECFCCWVCGSTKLRLVKPSNISAPLNSDWFKITDLHYGVTGDIFQCSSCGFMECPTIGEVIGFYQELNDPDYEKGRNERALQMSKVLKFVQQYRTYGRLLDIGAGTGVLVEEALNLGFQAEGVEPSEWLQQQACKRGLPVFRGTVPHAEITGPYDVVTLIDVIEHVDSPIEILEHLHNLMAEEGRGVIVTPDVSSWAARILGWKWWHFRVAHIGYFNRQTLLRALKKVNLYPLAIRRAGWVFTGDYLFDRIKTYLPAFLRIRTPRFLGRVQVPVNLLDSFMIVVAKRGDKSRKWQ